MALMGVVKFEEFFRLAAGLDVDKDDLRRLDDFINRKLYDLLVRGVDNARLNGHVAIEPHDLPITKGLLACMLDFKSIDAEIDQKSILDELTRKPPLDLPYGEETEARLPLVAGGIGVALARSFKIVEPDLKNPQTRHWETSFRIFDLLL